MGPLGSAFKSMVQNGPQSGNYRSFFGNSGNSQPFMPGAANTHMPAGMPPTPAPTGGSTLLNSGAGIMHPNINTSPTGGPTGIATPAPTDTGSTANPFGNPASMLNQGTPTSTTSSAGGTTPTNTGASPWGSAPPSTVPPPVSSPVTATGSSPWGTPNPSTAAPAPQPYQPAGSTTTTGATPPYSADPNMGGVPVQQPYPVEQPSLGGPPPPEIANSQAALQYGYKPYQMPNGQWRLIPPGGPAMGGHFLDHAVARQTGQINQVHYNEDGTIKRVGQPPRPFANGDPNSTAGNKDWAASIAAMPPEQQGQAIYNNINADKDLRLTPQQLQLGIQTGQQSIASLQAWIDNPANAGNAQEKAIYQGYIANEQKKIDALQAASDLRGKIGPYMQYLPKNPQGDIDWNAMYANPNWANSLPDNVKTALFDMHIGEYAKMAVGGLNYKDYNY